jgi:type II secretory pathway component GspD/PulD (secretin)
MIDEVVRSLDVPMPQVMLEVEVLDVSKNELDEIGVQWANPIASLSVTGARMTRFPFGGMGTSGSGGTMTATTGGWTVGPWPADQFAPSVLQVIGQDLQFDFLNTLSDIKVLARPKILTLSNETAEIKLITDTAISASRSESEEGQDIQYSIDRKELGTTLRMTPQVDVYTGDITLFVDIIVSNAQKSDFKIEDKLLVGDVLDPQERRAKSIARLKPGETLLMGGMILQDKTKTVIKLPVLGDIPFLGRFFRHDKIENDQRELLVFITPKIIGEGIASTARMSTPHREQQYSYRSDAMRAALNKLSAY